MIEAMKQAIQLLGPVAPDCCGCEYEWREAIKVLQDAIEVAEKRDAPNIKVNVAGTVAVAQDVFWLPIDAHAPLGVRLLLINKAAGRATDGNLGSHEKFFDHYQAFPKFRS